RSERLRERADLLVPPALEDRGRDLLARVLPPLDSIGGADAVGQRDRAVERHPTHQLRVHEVTRLAPDLPDALILLTPTRTRGIRVVGEEAPRLGADPLELIRETMRGIEQLAVDVELTLRPRAVADTHGRAVAPPAQVREFALGEVALATEPE